MLRIRYKLPFSLDVAVVLPRSEVLAKVSCPPTKSPCHCRRNQGPHLLSIILNSFTPTFCPCSWILSPQHGMTLSNINSAHRVHNIGIVSLLLDLIAFRLQLFITYLRLGLAESHIADFDFPNWLCLQETRSTY